MDWHYRGEGNCSLVVSDPSRKKVYRLLKQNYTKKFNGPISDPQAKEQAIYSDLAQVVSYVRWVMQPLLSPNYVVVPKLTVVDQEFIVDVMKQASCQRPARRLKKTGDMVDEELRTALILPDFCFVPSTEGLSRHHHSTISVEIKPKKSFIIAHSDLEEDTEQSEVCKFCMHQHLKCQAGEWPETSDYCPLDLFSGNRKRMRHALQSLIKTPQNNLKIWKDGVEIHSAETKEDLTSILYEWFEDFSLKKSRAVNCFLDLVIEILLMSVSLSLDDPPHADLTRSPTLQRCQSSSFSFGQNGLGVCRWLPRGSVLERVYAAQLLDDLDVLGVYPLYLKLTSCISENSQLRSEWGFDGHFAEDWLLDSEAFQVLEPGSLPWTVQKVKRFLVSKTLQDCSIMVAVVPLSDMEAEEYTSTTHDSNLLMFDQRWYKVSVALVDLDPKPLDKIPTYYRQTSAILASYQDNAAAATIFKHDTPSTAASTGMISEAVFVDNKSRSQGQGDAL